MKTFKNDEDMTVIQTTGGDLTFKPLGETTSILLPNGSYVIGDPCYSLGAERKIWDVVVYEAMDGARNPAFTAVLDGVEFTAAVFSTSYGDGVYPAEGTDTRFPVDAGLIGAVPLELLERLGVDPEEYSAMTETFTSDSAMILAETDGSNLTFSGDSTLTIMTGD